MKKIIKGAFQRFTTECFGCGCGFEYDREDVVVDSDGNPEVACPECGYRITHYFSNGIEGTRKEVKSDEEVDNDWVGEGTCYRCCDFEVKKLYPYKHPHENRTYLVCKSCLNFLNERGWYNL